MGRGFISRGAADVHPPPACRLGPADHGRTLTLEEYEEAEFEGEGAYELSRGVLEVVQTAAEYPHEMIVHFLMAALYEYAAPIPSGSIGSAAPWPSGSTSRRCSPTATPTSPSP